MRWLAAKYLAWTGWTFTGHLPDIPKMVVIGAPHTSNWDFVVFLAALRHYDMRASFIANRNLFRWPFGYLFERWGGIPVDHSRPGGTVGHVVRAMDATDQMTLVIAPEGTRKATAHWKDGFLHIARGAGATVVLGYLDYPTRTAGLGPVVEIGERVGDFMDRVRDFYADKEGLHSEGKGPVRLRDESESTP